MNILKCKMDSAWPLATVGTQEVVSNYTHSSCDPVPEKEYRDHNNATPILDSSKDYHYRFPALFAHNHPDYD